MVIKTWFLFLVITVLITLSLYAILFGRNYLTSLVILRNNSQSRYFSEPILQKLQERKQNQIPTDSSETGLCHNQREGYYIQFLDISLSGPGLLHRKEDFANFVKFAFNTERILVDNVPELTSRHELLNGGRGKLRGNGTGRSFNHLPMSFFYDVENILMESKFGDGTSSKCQLKVVTQVPQNFTSFVRVDYGARGKDNYKGNILMTLGRHTPSLNHPYRLVVNNGEGLRVSHWIRNLTHVIIRKYLQPIRNFNDYYVIHLRGRDRACLLNAPKSFVTNKLRRMKISSSETVYLMTDMKLNHSAVLPVLQYFGNSIISAKNIAIFQKYPFAVNNYLVFAVELGLAEMAKGFVDTYPGHYVGENLIATLFDHSYFFHPCQEKPESAKFLFMSLL